MRKTLRSVTIATIILVVTGFSFGALGTVSDAQSPMSGGLIGAGLGLTIALVASVHLVIRTLFGRVPESQTDELAADSVERAAFRRAGEKAFPDVLSLVLVAALLAAFLPDGPLLRWIPSIIAICAVTDFFIRASKEWKRMVSI